MEPAPSHAFPVTILRRGEVGGALEHRALIPEAPLIISVNWAQEYSIMRTPGHDEALTAGFLFTEGIIQSMEEVTLLRKCKGEKGGMDVSTVDAGRPAVKRATTISSSCGLCGRVELEALLEGLRPVEEAFPFPPDLLHDLPHRIRKAQELFHTTGASHAVALFDLAGEVVVLREDVGRHNAFDKVIGERLLARAPLAGHGAFLSGRASLEMIIKAARAGLPMVAAVSAPTDLAVRAAERLNITLCGFVRGREITIYCHPERITG